MSTRFLRVATTMLLAILVATAFAGTSLKLGATFPGWDRIRTGSIERAASNLARDYSRQLTHTCFAPEVFLRDRSRSIRSALMYYETYLPFNATENVLLDDRTQRVSLIYKPSSPTPVLSILVSIDGGVLLILC